MSWYKNSVNNFVAVMFALSAPTVHAQSNPNSPNPPDKSPAVQQTSGDQIPSAANSIQSLSVSSLPGGNLVLKVELKDAPAKPPLNFTINTPPRIAFDFPNTANGLGKSTQEFGEGDLRSANIVQAGNRTRLVINLNQMLVYDTQVDGNNLLITLHGKAAELVTGVAARFAEAKPSAQKHSLRDVDFHRGKNGDRKSVV